MKWRPIDIGILLNSEANHLLQQDVIFEGPSEELCVALIDKESVGSQLETLDSQSLGVLEFELSALVKEPESNDSVEFSLGKAVLRISRHQVESFELYPERSELLELLHYVFERKLYRDMLENKCNEKTVRIRLEAATEGFPFRRVRFGSEIGSVTVR